MIRNAEAARDAPACAAIYGPYVATSPVSLEVEPPTASEMARRIAAIGATHAWLVAEREGGVAGFAYASRHRERAAYRWAVDVAVYVDPPQHGRGIGRALYDALLPRLAEQGFHVACAGITLPNDASVRLHEAVGFEPVGVYRGIGWKGGAWRDVGWWQRRLIPADGPPGEPRAGRAGSAQGS